MAGPGRRTTKAETAAAEWHARLGAPDVSADVIEAFFDWRRDPAHADAWRRVEQVWGEARGLDADPRMQAALDEVLARTAGRATRSREGGLTRRGAWIGAAAAACAAGALAFGYWSWSSARTVFSTGVGEQRVVQLADGSSVRLDTASRVRVSLEGRERRLVLEAGQALFTVAHDPSRPFVVRAGAAEVTALGTVFDVRRRGETADVVLVSGAVRVRGGDGEGGTTRLAAGEAARVSGGRAVREAVDVAAATGWTEGRIVFHGTPLAEAVSEINRYLTVPVALDPGPAGAARIDGVFRAGDRDAFVAAAADLHHLDVVREADGRVRLSARGK